MAKLGINTGITPNDGNGDTLLNGAIKINRNFDEIYNYFGDGTNLTFTAEGSYWPETSAGIHTLSNVGVGTTNPTSTLTVKGNTSLDTLSVSGVSTFSGITTVTGQTLFAKQLNVSGVSTFSGITTVTGQTLFAKQLNVSGIVTATKFVGDGSGLTNLTGFLNNLVEDTSPQLGGMLDVNGKNITGIGSISLTGDVTSVDGFKSGSSSSGTFDAYHTRWGPGRTEQFRIRTFDNNLDKTPGIEFGISYANTEIHVRQYTGTFVNGFPSVISNQLTLLDTSGNTIVNNKLGIGTTNPTSKLTVVGQVSATSFIGDGSGLTNVVASNSGVVIKDSGSTVGTAGTIDFGDNLTVSPVSAGVVTVTASGGGGSAESYWVSTSAGIHTLSNVGVGTTNPTSALQVERYSISTGIGTFDALVGAAHTFDSFSIAESNYKTVEYTIHLENGLNVQSQKVLIMINGTNIYSQEYAIMFVPSQIVSVGATISSGVCEIRLLPSSGISGLTTYTFSRGGLL